MEIYTVSDSMLNELYESYSRYLTDPFSLERQTTMWKVNYFLGNGDVEFEPQPLKSRNNMTLPRPQLNETLYHFKVLIHLLASSSFENFNGSIKLNSSILYKLDKYYKLKLDVLLMSGFILKDIDYEWEFSKITYFINKPDVIFIEDTKNMKIIKVFNQVETELEKFQQKRLEELAALTTKSFVKSYNNSLKEFCINRAAAIEFINESDILNLKSKQYYTKAIDNFRNIRFNRIIEFDDNNRIYHLGTMLPRALKKFTNITNTIDAKNSHPYLFNYIILNHFFNNSSLVVSDNLHDFYFQIFIFFHKYYSSHNNNSYYTFNIRKDLCMYLINNNIQVDKIAIIKQINIDVFEYMYRTTIGQLWVQLVEKSEGRYTKEQLKGEMFKKLFYNKQLRLNKDADPLVLFFSEEYPTIYQILLSFKRELRQALKGAEKKDIKKIKHKHHLANKLMRLESQIFLGALKTIYQSDNQCRCIHIHDAIAIINNSVNVDYVQTVLFEKYKAFGLMPTFSVD